MPEPLDADAPAAVVALRVRGGTYVRAFARDLGAAFGVPAHLAALRRTRAGAADLGAAVPFDGLADAEPVDPVALLGMPTVVLDDALLRRVRDGRREPAGFSGRAALVDAEGGLVAVADAVDDRIVAVRVWRGPI
jgi:tRNA pseudouridine55 synthase